ncbi:MAG: arabinan endo-1,5-alpha-L-arabinosidase [Clostridiales bacterium]|jgi:arabinan endo-1,5-alpha-L-arabinosidase|nr:arabinan endo-1,5-alpha-L-arabinosidase [Clostridiales bacterium]
MNEPKLIGELGELGVHDPSIFIDNGMYYVFSTDAGPGHSLGVQIRRSHDLVSWEHIGVAFQDFSSDCLEAIEYSRLNPDRMQGLWAPDIMKVGDEYRLYFAASTLGSSRSCICLATSRNAGGPYDYKGIVLKSDSSENSTAESPESKFPNAIDPSFATGEDGKLYMAYGSFFGGIFIAEVDRETGFLAEPRNPKRIAGAPGAAVEGAYILHIPESGFYYLFVSYGALSSNYNIRLGRAKSPLGPYLDAKGNDMAFGSPGGNDSIGTKLMGGFTLKSSGMSVKAPGHNSAIVDGGNYFIAHHGRSYSLPGYQFFLNIRQFWLNSHGWPVAAPSRYHNDPKALDSLPDGVYDLVEHLADSNKESHDSKRFLLCSGKLSSLESHGISGELSFVRENRIELRIFGNSYDGVAVTQYDWSKGIDVPAFTAMSEDGLCVWGIKAY